jgi:hypothetical protein
MKRKNEELNTGWGIVKLSELHKAGWNYKEDDDELLQKLINNLRENGQVINCLIRETDSGLEVMDGNHRLDAMKVLEYEDAMCYNFGRITDARAQKIAIQANETRFATDNVRLAKLIENISKEFDMDDLIATLPFEEQELTDLVGLLNVNWESINKKAEDDDDEEGGGEKKYYDKFDNAFLVIIGRFRTLIENGEDLRKFKELQKNLISYEVLSYNEFKEEVNRIK